MGQHYEKTVFLVVTSLETNDITGTTLIGEFIERNVSKKGLLTPITPSSVAIVDAARQENVLTIERHGNKDTPEQLTAKQQCVVT